MPAMFYRRKFENKPAVADMHALRSVLNKLGTHTNTNATFLLRHSHLYSDKAAYVFEKNESFIRQTMVDNTADEVNKNITIQLLLANGKIRIVI